MAMGFPLLGGHMARYMNLLGMSITYRDDDDMGIHVIDCGRSKGWMDRPWE